MTSLIITFSFFLLYIIFSIKLIFERVSTLSAKKGLTVLRNILLFVTSFVLILPKNVCFASLVRLTQLLRCLIYVFLFHFWCLKIFPETRLLHEFFKTFNTVCETHFVKIIITTSNCP